MIFCIKLLNFIHIGSSDAEIWRHADFVFFCYLMGRIGLRLNFCLALLLLRTCSYNLHSCNKYALILFNFCVSSTGRHRNVQHRCAHAHRIALRMRALGTRIHYNLLQFTWALQRSSTELPARSVGRFLTCLVQSGRIFKKKCSVSVGFLYNFFIAICHLFGLTSTSVIIWVFWSYNLLFPCHGQIY